MPRKSVKKKSPKRKGRKQSAKVPLRIKILLGILIVLVVGGVASVKLFQTTKGRVLLLDSGFDAYYSQVQIELDAVLRGTLRSEGLSETLRVGVTPERIGGERRLVRTWNVSCDPPCSLVQVNLALTRAVEKAGAVVRSGIEDPNRDGGGAPFLVLDAGSRKYTTHRIEITQQPPEPKVTIPEPKGPRLALVIDDLGYSRSEVVEKLMSIDIPLTFAVIPSLSHSRYAISQAWERGKQAILHVPMEAEDNPTDENTVMTTMTDEEITTFVEDLLSSNPGVLGINNHMGSLATQDRRVMERVMAVLKARELFFFDSLTSPKSIAYNTAKSLGVPTARNDVFLDADTEDDRVVEERLMSLLQIARSRGSAIGIGHPKRWTYEAIKRNEQFLKESGVEIVFISELVD